MSTQKKIPARVAEGVKTGGQFDTERRPEPSNLGRKITPETEITPILATQLDQRIATHFDRLEFFRSDPAPTNNDLVRELHDLTGALQAQDAIKAINQAREVALPEDADTVQFTTLGGLNHSRFEVRTKDLHAVAVTPQVRDQLESALTKVSADGFRALEEFDRSGELMFGYSDNGREGDNVTVHLR